MPRYFFNRTDGFVDHDKEDTELDDLRSARVQAIIFAGESLRDHPKYVWGEEAFHVEVTDHLGRLLFTISTQCVDADPISSDPDSIDVAD